ncbi:MAG: radical SAM protein [Conexivisphaerales archaeon]
MVRVTLIRPSNYSGSAYLTKWGFLPAPLGILQLAGGILRIKGSSVNVIDMEADKFKTVNQVVDETLKFNPDVVGITLHATAAHNTAGEIARKIKEHKPNTVLVAGGHHATFLPYEMLRQGFDISVLGEGDITIIDISNAVEKGTDFSEIPGIVYKNGNKFIRTKLRPLIQDLDSLPMPALGLVNKDLYFFKTFGDNDTVTCIETARGCPYACDFCSVTPTWGNKWRNKSIDRIIAELDLAKKLGYDWVFFTDDIFVVYPNVKQRMKLFEKMIEHNYNFKFIVQMRADVTSKNPELIKKGAEAGMTIAFLGIESGSQETLKKMHKGTFIPQSVKAVEILNKYGVITLGGMMLGAPYESISDMLTTVSFSHKLADAGLDAVQFSMYTPLPGTRIFDDAVRNNLLFTLDWDRYDILTPVMRTRVHPVITQIIQWYGHYSFYILKYLKGRALGKKAITTSKNKLVKNATKFIFSMFPKYLKDLSMFPAFLFKTAKLYNSKTVAISGEKMKELLEFSGSIVYEEVGSKNPYFMIKEAEWT